MSKQDANWARAFGLGLEMAVGVGLGVFVGAWLDRKYHCDPWGVVIGAILGFAGGTYLLIKEATRINKK